ncbi:transcriptional regulator [Nocardia sp. NPDC056100]|uniref:transcriptional regulator n=1 Tax=Nocardia sp. NPDC056100 TaxID=3345712 RepID=UPI0035DD5A22
MVRSPGRGLYTAGEVCGALTAAGHPMSMRYLAQLRSGQRTDLPDRTVAALAKFFKVKPRYFTNAAYRAKVDHDLELMSQLQEYGLRRLSARAFNLSDESQALLTSMTEKLRALEGFPQIASDQEDFDE